jgi:hypothetical protein
MKVLFVSPEFPDTYWSFHHALAFTGKRAAFLPLGLLTVGGMLYQSLLGRQQLCDGCLCNVRELEAKWEE